MAMCLILTQNLQQVIHISSFIYSLQNNAGNKMYGVFAYAVKQVEKYQSGAKECIYHVYDGRLLTYEQLNIGMYG